MTVKFDEADKVVDVHGSTLNAGSDTLLYEGIPESHVKAILGKGVRRENTSPKSLGVFSVGSDVTGATLKYENAGNVVEITVHKDALRGIRITPSKDR
jgi:hypothetical protein